MNNSSDFGRPFPIADLETLRRWVSRWMPQEYKPSRAFIIPARLAIDALDSSGSRTPLVCKIYIQCHGSPTIISSKITLLVQASRTMKIPRIIKLMLSRRSEHAHRTTGQDCIARLPLVTCTCSLSSRARCSLCCLLRPCNKLYRAHASSQLFQAIGNARKSIRKDFDVVRLGIHSQNTEKNRLE